MTKARVKKSKADRTVVPLALPEDLQKEIRGTSEATGLSNADVMRLSIRHGLSKVRELIVTAQPA